MENSVQGGRVQVESGSCSAPAFRTRGTVFEGAEFVQQGRVGSNAFRKRVQTVTPVTRVRKRVQGAEGVCDPSDPLEPEFAQTSETCSEREFWGSFGFFCTVGKLLRLDPGTSTFGKKHKWFMEAWLYSCCRLYIFIEA